jgi:hypothetical protein
MAGVDGAGVPVGGHLHAASPSEVRLAAATLATIRVGRRWTVERTIAWLGNFRRLVVRYDRSLTIYQGFFHIACFMIVLRRVLN